MTNNHQLVTFSKDKVYGLITIIVELHPKPKKKDTPYSLEKKKGLEFVTISHQVRNENEPFLNYLFQHPPTPKFCYPNKTQYSVFFSFPTLSDNLKESQSSGIWIIVFEFFNRSKMKRETRTQFFSPTKQVESKEDSSNQTLKLTLTIRN